MEEGRQSPQGREEQVKQLAAWNARLGKALKACQKVASAQTRNRNPALVAGSELRAAAALLDELGREPFGDLCRGLREQLLELERDSLAAAEKEAMLLLSELSVRLAGEGMKLEGHYPEVTCGVFTLSLELTAKGMVASLFYGPRIEKLATIPGADLDKVAKMVRDGRKELEGGLMPAPEFLALAQRGWRLANQLANRAQGPAPILEVLGAVAYLRQDKSFTANPVRSRFQPYGATAFSYQLAQLRERRLGELELAMGLATRDDVKNRSTVWVPRNQRGDGNHYATIEFRRVSQDDTFPA